MSRDRHPGLWHARGMEQRLSFVTFAVRDLERSRAFYVDGLGWVPELEAHPQRGPWTAMAIRDGRVPPHLRSTFVYEPPPDPYEDVAHFRRAAPGRFPPLRAHLSGHWLERDEWFPPPKAGVNVWRGIACGPTVTVLAARWCPLFFL